MNKQERRQAEIDIARLDRAAERYQACLADLAEANVTIALEKQQIAGARKRIEKSKQPSVEYLLGILDDLDFFLRN
jgi:hypothetical protein